jgi:hypothetical protein
MVKSLFPEFRVTVKKYPETGPGTKFEEII